MTATMEASLVFSVFLLCCGNYIAIGISYSSASLSNERTNSLKGRVDTAFYGNKLNKPNFIQVVGIFMLLLYVINKKNMLLHSGFIVLIAAIFKLDKYNRETIIIISECQRQLIGEVGEQLGHASLEVYMLRNNYSRIVLPKLLFIRPTWSRIDTVLSALNKSFCGSVMKNTSSVKFPYFGKVDDFDVVALEMNVTDGNLVERRKFEFFLPFFPRRNLSNVDLWEVFLYVDISEPYRAAVFWERAPVELNITKYQLNVSCGDVSNIIEYEEVFFFEVPFDLTWSEMNCRFYVRPWLTSFSKWGYRSSSPPVIIMRGQVLHVWVFILCSLICTFTFLVCRLYRVIEMKCKHRVTGSALLIYEAKTEEQLNFVSLLAQTLEEDHDIKIHLDHRDIPLTETKDPLKWFVETLSNCEYFIFLQLPAPENAACVPPGVYSSQKMATDNVFRMFKNSSRIIMLELDSCPHEETWVCSKLRSRYKYILPKDLRILVGKEDPFSSPLGFRLKQSISQCIQEIKEFKKGKEVTKEVCVSDPPVSNLNQEEDSYTEDEEDGEIVVSGRSCLLESFNLGGVENESDSE